MIIFTLGSVASASTWIFNATRFITSFAGKAAFGLYAERAGDLLAGLPAGAEVVTVKCHSLDHACFVLLGLADTRLIVSLRDPRDSIASNMSRFGQTFPFVLTSLSHTYATIASLPDCKMLTLRYEDDPTSRLSTLRLIGKHIDIDAPEERLREFLNQNRPEVLRERIAAWSGEAADQTAPSKSPDDYHREAHWHPRHVGDGESGKWKQHLTQAQATATEDCLPDVSTGSGWRSRPIRWSSLLFSFRDGQNPSECATVLLKLNRLDCAVFGPYLHLPRGCWRVDADIKVRDGNIAVFAMDVFSIRTKVLALQTFSLKGSGGAVRLRFENRDHSDPLEIRIHSATPSVAGTEIEFGGVSLVWEGPSEDTAELVARPVA